MEQDPDREKLDAMAARIHKASGKPVESSQESAAPTQSSRVGFDFVGSVVGCAFLGWLIDKGLATQPWGLIIMILVGFAVGMVTVWKAMESQKS